MSPLRRLTAQDTKNTKAKTQNLKVKSLKNRTQNILKQNTMSLIGFRTYEPGVLFIGIAPDETPLKAYKDALQAKQIRVIFKSNKIINIVFIFLKCLFFGMKMIQ